MRLKPLAILVFLFSFSGNLSIAATANYSTDFTERTTDYWSVAPVNSVFDSLKIEVKKAILPNTSDALKEYINALQFREQLQASDLPLPAYPTSAGIYNGSLISDSLSADEQLLFLYRNLGDRKAEAGIVSSLGTKAAVNGDMDKALVLFQEALDINTELNNKPGIVKNYFSLARINRYKGNLAEAVKYNQSIVQLALESRNNRYLADAYLNLADLWFAQKKYKESETIIMQKALPLTYYTLHDKISVMKCYDQLAETYQAQQRYSEAKWFYIQSNMVARKINNPNGIVNSLVSLAHVKMTIGDHQLALRDIREAEQLSISNKYNFKLVEIKNDLSRVYTMLGNTSAANTALSEFTVLKDALLSGTR
jgi:tetratricopeptide (TPR) repeat protein